MSAPGELLRIGSAAELARFGDVEGAPGFDSAWLARHARDATWVLAGTGGRAEARCSLWWKETPPLPGEKPGLVGHCAARDARAGQRLLAHDCAELAAQACTVAISPMDGSTWRYYRLLVDRGPEAGFLLEPDNPDGWPDHFRGAGFDVLAAYFSAVAEDLAFEDPREAAAAARLSRNGLPVRALDPSRTDEELHRIYALSLASFGGNFPYTPIGEEEPRHAARGGVQPPRARPRLPPGHPRADARVQRLAQPQRAVAGPGHPPVALFARALP